MSDKKIRFMVTAAVMAALTYVATTVVRIPAPTGGYVHMGDGLVLLCGWILGPWWGGAAAGIGSMLVDLLGGYMSFVPGTLVIKFLDAMAAALIVKALGRRTYSYVLGGIAGEAIMVAGYFVYEAAALKLGMGAAAGVLANVGQGAVGLVIALVLMALLKGSKALDKLAVVLLVYLSGYLLLPILLAPCSNHGAFAVCDPAERTGEVGIAVHSGSVFCRSADLS